MTLSVSAYYRNEDGSQVELPLQSNVAGVERARIDFYGSEQTRLLGLKLLPVLKEYAMLEVCGSELPILLAEVSVLLESLSSGEEGEYWRVRLNNIKEAIQLASAYGESGCVSIG